MIAILLVLMSDNQSSDLIVVPFLKYCLLNLFFIHVILWYLTDGISRKWIYQGEKSCCKGIWGIPLCTVICMCRVFDCYRYTTHQTKQNAKLPDIWTSAQHCVAFLLSKQVPESSRKHTIYQHSTNNHRILTWWQKKMH